MSYSSGYSSGAKIPGWGLLIFVVGLLSFFLSAHRQMAKEVLHEPKFKQPPVARLPQQSPKLPQRKPATASPALTKDIDSFLNQIDPQKKWVINRSPHKKITAISGGLIHLPIGDTKTPFEWARKLAEWSGVPAEQIEITESPLPETGFSRTVQYHQAYQGYRVDQSFVRLTERKSDHAILHSQIELQDIGEPNLTINFKQQEVALLAQGQFAPNHKTQILSISDAPSIFLTAPGQSELAWKLSLKITGPLYDERRIVISAFSGKTLIDVSSLQY